MHKKVQLGGEMNLLDYVRSQRRFLCLLKAEKDKPVVEIRDKTRPTCQVASVLKCRLNHRFKLAAGWG